MLATSIPFASSSSDADRKRREKARSKLLMSAREVPDSDEPAKDAHAEFAEGKDRTFASMPLRRLWAKHERYKTFAFAFDIKKHISREGASRALAMRSAEKKSH